MGIVGGVANVYGQISRTQLYVLVPGNVLDFDITRHDAHRQAGIPGNLNGNCHLVGGAAVNVELAEVIGALEAGTNVGRVAASLALRADDDLVFIAADDANLAGADAQVELAAGGKAQRDGMMGEIV